MTINLPPHNATDDAATDPLRAYGLADLLDTLLDKDTLYTAQQVKQIARLVAKNIAAISTQTARADTLEQATDKIIDLVKTHREPHFNIGSESVEIKET